MAVTKLMKEQCIGIVSAHIGRELKPAESAEVLAEMRTYMVKARKQAEVLWDHMSYGQRVDLAGQMYAESLKGEAAKVRQRARLAVLAQAEAERSIALHRRRGYHGFDAGVEFLSEVDRKVAAAESEVKSDFAKVLEGKQQGLMGLMEDEALAQAVVRETFGEDTGSAIAKAVAGEWKRFSDMVVDRYNRAGGNMGKLDRYVPQAHDCVQMAHAAEVLAGDGRLKIGARALGDYLKGRPERFRYETNQQAWADYLLPRLDRSQYLDSNGEVMDDDALREVLYGMYDTLLSDGTTNFEVSTVAGARGNGGTGRANRGDNHRSIFFKDADSFFQYHQTFGKGTIFTNMMGSLGRSAKDAALLENLGPNPNNLVRGVKRMCDAEAKQIQARNMSASWVKRTKLAGVSTSHFFDSVWGTLNGDAAAVSPGREMIASIGGGLRNTEVFSKLGNTFLAAVSDIPTYFVTSGINHINRADATTNLVRAWSADSKALASVAGLMADSLTMTWQRMGQNNVGEGWTGMLANLTMKLTLLDQFTNGVRRGQMIGLMHTMANMTRRPWRFLTDFDKRRLERIGVTQKDWYLWQSAMPYEMNGARYLTRQDIRAINLERVNREAIENGSGLYFTQRDVDQSVAKYIAFLQDEAGLASLAPDLATRAVSNIAGARGTFGGEVMRNLMLFKSFPIGFMRRHLQRLSDMPTGRDRIEYAAKIFVGTTLAGAITVQLRALVAGRDLQDPTSQDYWLQAMSTGGGLSFLSDIIVAGIDGQNAYGSPNFLKFLGPVAGSALDAFDVVKTGYNDLTGSSAGGAYNREMKSPAKALKFVRNHAPFVNFWYVKGLVDRAVYNDLMEAASPGYIARMKGWGRKHTGQEYWWNVDEVIPERLPTVADAPDR